MGRHRLGKPFHPPTGWAAARPTYMDVHDRPGIHCVELDLSDLLDV